MNTKSSFKLGLINFAIEIAVVVAFGVITHKNVIYLVLIVRVPRHAWD